MKMVFLIMAIWMLLILILLFSLLNQMEAIFGTNIIEGSGRAIVLLLKGTRLHIKNAFYSPKSNRNLLSFNDIRLNGYHIKTNNEGDIEYLYITQIELDIKRVLEKLLAFSYGLYYTYSNSIEMHVIIS